MIKKRIATIIMVAVLTFSFVACNKNDNGDKKNDATSRTFAEFTDEYFREDMKSSTVGMNFTLKEPANYGIDKYDVIMADMSIDDMETTAAMTTKTYNELKSFDYAKLTENEQLTYDILEYSLESDKRFNDLYINYDPLTLNSGAHTAYPYYMGEFRFYDKEQNIKDFMIMLTQFGKLFDEIMIIENKRVESGIFMQDFALEKVITQCQTFIDENPNSIIQSFNERIDAFKGLDDAKKQAYKGECKDKVETQVIPAYKSLIEQLVKLKGSSKTSGALCETPDGKRYYEYIYRTQTGATRTPSKMAGLLESMINDRIDDIGEIMQQDSDIFERLEKATNPIQDPTTALNSLIQSTKADFPDIGTVDFAIKSYPKSQEDNGSSATYFYNAIDDISKNSIYMNNSVLDPKSIYTFMTIAHEGFPGHMYQMNYFKNSDPMLVRHSMGFTGYSEGWTTYIEGYALKYALKGDTNLVRMMQIDSSVGNIAIARADIGIHYEGWSYERFVEFMSFMVPEESCKSIYEDIIASPGFMLPYGCGYAEMTDLRKFAEEKLGDKFDAINFHKTILDVGPAPYNVVKQELINYIDTVIPKADETKSKNAA